MIAKDEDALICDMAQYYHIYRMRELPVKTLAVLAFGLPPDSRIKILFSGSDVSPQLLLTAIIADKLSTLIWMQTKDGKKGVNRPVSIVEAISKARAGKKSEVVSFKTGDAFLAARNRLIGG